MQISRERNKSMQNGEIGFGNQGPQMNPPPGCITPSGPIPGDYEEVPSQYANELRDIYKLDENQPC